MRFMKLPELPVGPQHSLEDCIRVYLKRLPADDALWPHVSLLLTAYIAWPNDEPRRNSCVATYLARFIQNSDAETASNMPTAMASNSEGWIAFEKFGGLG